MTTELLEACALGVTVIRALMRNDEIRSLLDEEERTLCYAALRRMASAAFGTSMEVDRLLEIDDLLGQANAEAK